MLDPFSAVRSAPSRSWRHSGAAGRGAVLADLLAMRDRVAVLDPNEDPDGPAGCAAAEILSIHNRIVTGDLPDDAA